MTAAGDAAEPGRARALIAGTLAVNAALCLALFVVGFFFRSELVVAQGADSLVDLAVGIVLLITVRVGAQPRDENHPFGHQRAEPIGALVTAVLAAVLAFEVARSAVGALVAGAAPVASGAAIAVLTAKLVVKVALLAALKRTAGGTSGPALAATRLDTLADVLSTAGSLLGFAAVRLGWAWADAAMALLVAAYIARNGWDLARQSLRYLLGEAPDAEVLAALRASAAVPGVREVSKLRAHFVGRVLHVEVTILIAVGSTAKQSHDLALDIQRAVERHPLVGEVFVHIDTGEGKDGT